MYIYIYHICIGADVSMALTSQLSGGGGSAESPAHGARDLASRGDSFATQQLSMAENPKN